MPKDRVRAIHFPDKTMFGSRLNEKFLGKRCSELNSYFNKLIVAVHSSSELEMLAEWAKAQRGGRAAWN